MECVWYDFCWYRSVAVTKGISRKTHIISRLIIFVIYNLLIKRNKEAYDVFNMREFESTTQVRIIELKQKRRRSDINQLVLSIEDTCDFTRVANCRKLPNSVIRHYKNHTVLSVIYFQSLTLLSKKKIKFADAEIC